MVLSNHFRTVVVRLGDAMLGHTDFMDMTEKMQNWANIFCCGHDWKEADMTGIAALLDPDIKEVYAKYKRYVRNPKKREEALALEPIVVEAALKVVEYEHGLRDGMVKGKTEGKAEERESIAKNMKAKGKSIADIAETTGLPIAEIKKL